jgi:hypothetical protein
MTAFIAKGTKFEYSTDGSIYVEMGEMTELDGVSTKSAQVDTTNHSTQDLFRTSIAGLKDLSEITLTCNANGDEYATIYALASAVPTTELDFKITYPFSLEGSSGVDKVLSFKGYFQDIPIATPVDDVAKYTISIAISSAVTLA